MQKEQQQQQEQQHETIGQRSNTTVLTAKLQKPANRYISIEDRDHSVVVLGELSYCKLSRTASTIRIRLRPMNEQEDIEVPLNLENEPDALNAMVLLTQTIKEYIIGARDILEIASKLVSEKKNENASKGKEIENPQ